MEDVKELNSKIRWLGVNRVAKASGLNKSTISRYINGERAYSVKNFERIKRAVTSIELGKLRGRTSVREATHRVSLGEPWRIAYFDFVDSFRATRSRLLILEKPVDGLEIKSLALICSIVMELCDELKITPPEWASLCIGLEQPWFISKFKSLRAMSLVESSIYFKRNNIFVGGNFLERA